MTKKESKLAKEESKVEAKVEEKTKEATEEAANKPKEVDKEQAKGANQQNASEFGIRQIYIKNLSYEAPNAFEALGSNWQPQVGLDLQTKATKIKDDLYEIVLRITATVKSNDKTAFLIEVDQAGIFSLKDFADAQLGYMLGSYCPNILFPYAREIVADAVMRGGFPPLYLAPVNFDLLYEQHLKKKV